MSSSARYASLHCLYPQQAEAGKDEFHIFVLIAV